MKENFTLKGEWWLPANPNNKISGTIEYSPEDGILLETIGSFCQTSDPMHLDESLYPFIHGITNECKIITLQNVSRTNHNWSATGVVITKYCASKAVIGWHFSDEKELIFNIIYAELTHLSAWLCISGFNVEKNFESKQYKVEYSCPHDIELFIYDGITISVGWTYIIPGSSIIPKSEIKLSEHPYLCIKSEKLVSIKTLEDYLHKVSSLISFFYGKPLSILSISTISNDLKIRDNIREYSPTITHFRKCDTERWSDKELIPLNQIAPYLFIKNQIAEIIAKFFNEYEQINPVISLYVYLKKLTSYRIDQYLLNLAQIVEAFHRRLMTDENFELLEDEHNERINAILSICPDTYKKWLKEKLNFSNEISFKNRISKLWNHIPHITSHFPYTEANYTKLLKDIRNHYTHYSVKSKFKLPSFPELHKMAFITQIFIDFLMLDWLGLDKNTCETKAKEIISKYNVRFF